MYYLASAVNWAEKGFITLLLYCVSQVKRGGVQNSPLYADIKPHPYCVLQNFLNGMGIFTVPHSYILHINTILGNHVSYIVNCSYILTKCNSQLLKLILAA